MSAKKAEITIEEATVEQLKAAIEAKEEGRKKQLREELATIEKRRNELMKALGKLEGTRNKIAHGQRLTRADALKLRNAIKVICDEPQTLAQIDEALKNSKDIILPSSLSQLIFQMCKAGELTKPARGVYQKA